MRPTTVGAIATAVHGAVRDGADTAIASVIAANPTKGVVTISGMAPKAWLGNYKVFGSPNVNDYPSEAIFIQAINARD